jgi:bleomycin hydrolase
MSTTDSTAALTPADVTRFQTHFEADPKNRVALNAVTRQPINEVALSRATLNRTNHTYSHQLKSNTAANQQKSGRCWMFAGLNLFRVLAMEKLNIKEFELSQTYPMFWDKLEKANYFLESILTTLDEPTDGRLIMHLLQSPIQDGGQWDMFANLIRKYGVVPKAVMPETHSSSNSRAMNSLITARLRENAAELRRMAAAGDDLAALRARKTAMLDGIYRMLCIHLGEPPQTFDWQWRDKDDEFHRTGTLTPQAFFAEYVAYPLDDMACLIHCPTDDKPFDRMYTIEYLGNVVEGDIIRYANVDMVVFKQAAVEMIKHGQPVWFGCDVGKRFHRDLGILDTALYDLDLVYGEPFTADKAERITYGQSVMTHAMVLTGVDLDEEGQPVKWRVENSWGTEGGDKGFLVMSDAWFDEYMYEVLIDCRHLPEAVRAMLEQAPVKLPPWDPMGALAAAE